MIKKNKKILIFEKNIESNSKIIMYDLENEVLKEIELAEKFECLRIFQDGENNLFLINKDYENYDENQIFNYNLINDELLKIGKIKTSSRIELIFEKEEKIKMIIYDNNKKEYLIYEYKNTEWIQIKNIKIVCAKIFYWLNNSLVALTDSEKIIFSKEKIIIAENLSINSDHVLDHLDNIKIYDFFNPCFCLCSNFISIGNSINLLNLNTSEILFLFNPKDHNSLFLSAFYYNGIITAFDDNSRIYYFDLEKKTILKILEGKIKFQKKNLIQIKKIPFLKREFNLSYEKEEFNKNLQNSIFEFKIKQPSLIEYTKDFYFRKLPLKINRNFINPNAYILDDHISCTHRINKNLLFIIRSNYGFLLFDLITRSIIKVFKVKSLGFSKSVRINNRIIIEKQNTIYHKPQKKFLVFDLDNFVLLKELVYLNNRLFFNLFNDLMIMNHYGDIFIYDFKLEEWKKLNIKPLNYKFKICRYEKFIKNDVISIILKTISKKIKFFKILIQKKNNKYQIDYEIKNKKSKSLIKLFESRFVKILDTYTIYFHLNKKIIIYEFDKEIFEINFCKKDIRKFIENNKEHKFINSYLNYQLSLI